MLILKRPTTLRDGLTFKYNIISVYRNILEYADLPYKFDHVNRKWWRYFSDIYGFYYSRVHRSYTIWLSTGLKKNIGLYMPFLMRMPVKRSKAIDTWKRRSYLYKDTLSLNTLDSWHNPRYFKKLDFSKFNFYNSTKSTIYSNFAGNSEHYAHSSQGSFGLDEESIFSGYNAKWHDIYRYWASFYRIGGSAPTSLLIGVNSFYMWSGFFINLFDTTITIYPEHYLVYYNYIFVKNIDNIINPYMSQIIDFFVLNFNGLYYKLLFLLFDIFMRLFNKKLNNLTKIYLNPGSTLNYRINLFFIFMNYYIYKNIKFNKYDMNSLRTFRFFLLKSSLKSLDNVYLRGFISSKLNNNDFYSYLIIEKEKSNSLNFSFLRKIFLLNIINLKRLAISKAVSYRKQKNQSNFFINVFNSIWTSQIYSKINNNLVIRSFTRTINNFINSRVNHYKIHSFTSFSLVNFKKKFNLDIKRILTYGKLFLKIPSKLLKFKLRLTKASALIANKGFFRTFLFTFYQKNIFNKIIKFNYNFFFIITSLIRINYGFSFSLLKFKRTSYKNLDNLFFYNLKYFMFKYFKFLNIYLKKDISQENIFLTKNLHSYRFLYLYLFNVFSSKSRKKINIFLSKKIRYFDYCYRGLNIKFLKNKK